MVPSVTIGHT